MLRESSDILTPSRARSAAGVLVVPSWRTLVAPAAVLAFALLLVVPWQPQLVSAELDFSWNAALYDAFVRRLQFGRDVVFTFGPLGWVFHGLYFPGAFGLLLAYWALVAVALGLGCWMLLRDRVREPLLRAAAAVALLALLSLNRDAMLFALPALLLARWFSGGWRWRADGAWLVVALGVTALVKFTLLLAGAFVVGIITLDELRRRRSAWVLGLFSAVFLVGWLLCGQPLAGLPGYVRASMEISRGYSDAMAIAVQPVWVVLGYVVASLALAAVSARRIVRDRAWREALATLGALGLLLLVFKAAFVRRDVHVLIAAAVLPFVAAVHALALGAGGTRPAGDRSRGRRWTVGLDPTDVGVIALALVVALATRAAYFGPTSPHVVHLPTTVARNALALLRLAAGGPTAAERGAQRAAEIRARYPFAGITGRVDILGNEQAALLAHGLAYAPRPTIQSYSAYTPWLAELNARHFRGPAAPDHVLLGSNTIDDRYPGLDDAPARLELLRSYDVEGIRGSYLLLRRRATPREVRLTPRSSRAVSLVSPTPIAIPADGAVWATLTLRPTLLGRLRSTLYKAPEVVATVTLAGGAERHFRLIPEMTRSGFLLSPLAPGDASAPFVALAAGRDARGSAPRVVGLRVEVRSRRPGLFFAPTAQLALFAVTTAPAAAPLPAPDVDRRQAPAAAGRAATACVPASAADCAPLRTRLGCTDPSPCRHVARARPTRRPPVARAAASSPPPAARPNTSPAR